MVGAKNTKADSGDRQSSWPYQPGRMERVNKMSQALCYRHKSPFMMFLQFATAVDSLESGLTPCQLRTCNKHTLFPIVRCHRFDKSHLILALSATWSLEKSQRGSHHTSLKSGFHVPNLGMAWNGKSNFWSLSGDEMRWHMLLCRT